MNCENKNGFKECIVPESHFNKGGYYYTYYNNSLGQESIAYESPKIKIILKQDKPDESDKSDKPNESDKPNNSNSKNLVGIIVGSVVGGLVLIGIIIFFVVRYYRKKKLTIDDFSEKNENVLLASNKDEDASDN